MSGKINNVGIKKVNLTPDFQLDVLGIFNAVDAHTKILFICSPNNPTGNNMKRADIEILLNNFPGIILIDEAYINFAKQKSFVQELTEYPNLVVMQTFSKAWGLAGLRWGMAFASTAIIEILTKVKPPSHLNQATRELVFKDLEDTGRVNDMNWPV